MYLNNICSLNTMTVNPTVNLLMKCDPNLKSLFNSVAYNTEVTII